MKKSLAFILIAMALLLCLCPTFAFAEEETSGKCGDNLTWSFDEVTGILTITGSGAMMDFRNECPWDSVKDKIVDISLPSGLTSISAYAFEYCTGLTSITIPDSVTSIGHLAFWGTGWWEAQSDGLVYLGKILLGYKGTIPKSINIASGTEIIADSAFWDCTELTSVTIPSSVTTIGYHAFEGCTGLTAINVELGSKNFCSVNGVLFSSDKTKLLLYPACKEGGYSIPNGVKSIEDFAFIDCTGLTSITIPDSVTKIGWYSFYDCSNLTSLTIPSGVTKMDGTSFGACTGLKSIQVAQGNKSFTSVDGVLFSYNMKALFHYPAAKQQTSYVIPNGVTTLEYCAFYGSGLTSITIPSSVTSVGFETFSKCAVKDFYYLGTEEQAGNIQVFDEDSNDPFFWSDWHYQDKNSSPMPESEQISVMEVQAKKSVKLQAPKIKKATYLWQYRTSKNAPWQSMGKKGTKQKLSVKAAMALDGYQYRCQVKAPTGTISYTDIYELYVYEQLKVKKQPKWGKKVLPGAKMTLSITAQGASSYQWVTRPNGSSPWTKIDGATGTSYVVDVQEGMNNRQYACEISGKAGTTRSKAAVVKIAPWPKVKITRQPQWKKPVASGSPVTLTVKALNAETYQWYYRTSKNGAWIIMGGETKTTVTFPAPANGNGYQYKCTAKGKGGTVDSKPVTLKMVTP